jgi:hypothetical protein
VRPRLLLPGALLTVAAPLAACSASGPGPLGNGGIPGSQCDPGAVGHTLTMGIYGLANSGTSDVIVTGVRLAHPHGLSITKSAWVVPDVVTPGEDLGVGVEEDYPPVSWPTWSKREAIPGALVRPRQDELSLVFGLTRTTSRAGHSGGPVITYTANGNTYRVQERTALVVTAAKTCA